METEIQEYESVWKLQRSEEHKMGQLKYLIRKVEKFPFDIVVLQGTKKLGQEMMENEDTSFFDSGGRNRMLGTGFL